MACSMHLVLLVAILLSLAGTPETVPVHRGRGGWTLNSAGYLLGPVVHLPSNADQGRKRDSALEILDLWKAIDGLPYSRSPQMTKRSLVETFIRPKSEEEPDSVSSTHRVAQSITPFSENRHPFLTSVGTRHPESQICMSWTGIFPEKPP